MCAYDGPSRGPDHERTWFAASFLRRPARAHQGPVLTRRSNSFAVCISRNDKKEPGRERRGLREQYRAGSIWFQQRQQTGKQQAAEEPTATQKMWHGWWRITSSQEKRRTPHRGKTLTRPLLNATLLTAHEQRARAQLFFYSCHYLAELYPHFRMHGKYWLRGRDISRKWHVRERSRNKQGFVSRLAANDKNAPQIKCQKWLCPFTVKATW